MRIISEPSSQFPKHTGNDDYHFVIMILTIYTTLIYKQRLLQIKLNALNLLLHMLLVVVTFFLP
jgi:hypothetical protein